MGTWNNLPLHMLGIVVGRRSPGDLAVIRLLLKGMRLYGEHVFELYDAMRGQTIFHFMLRLLTDYLEEPPYLPWFNLPEEAIFKEILSRWRDPDPDALVPACLAACDLHTHRCVPGKLEHEFQNGCHYFPVEILLLFRLRQFLGLENPKLDHPLMNASLATLPEEVVCEEDDLLRRGRKIVLEKSDFDEAEIFARFLADGDEAWR